MDLYYWVFAYLAFIVAGITALNIILDFFSGKLIEELKSGWIFRVLWLAAMILLGIYFVSLTP